MSHEDRIRNARQRRRRLGASAIGLGAGVGAALAAAMIPAGIASADDLVGEAAAVTAAVPSGALVEAARSVQELPRALEAARAAQEALRAPATTVGGGAVAAPPPTVGGGTVVAPPTTGGGGTVVTPPTTGGGGTVVTPPTTGGGGIEPVTVSGPEADIDHDLNVLLGDLGVPSSDFTLIDTDVNDFLNTLPASVLQFLDTLATDIFGPSAVDATTDATTLIP